MGQKFRDLKVYIIALELAKEVQQITDGFPLNEQYKITDQILRSSRSIIANIAEGYARRGYKRDFIKFLNYALGSSEETQVHLEIACSNGLIDENKFCNLLKKYKNLSTRIFNFIIAIKSNDQH